MGPSGWLWVAGGVGLYVALAWIGFTLRLWQLNRMARALETALEGTGAKGGMTRPSAHFWKPAEVDAEIDGKKVRFSVRQWGRDSQAIGVHVPAAPLPAVYLRKERTVDRMGKAIGLDREVQLGDAPFDAAVYIASSAADATVKELLGPDEARRAIQEIVADGFSVMTSSRGVGAVTLAWSARTPDPGPLLAMVPRLERLAELLPRMAPDLAGDLRQPPSPNRIILATLAFVMVPVLLVLPGVRAVAPPLLEARDVTSVLLVGFALWPVAVYVAARMLRGRPLAMFELLAVSIGLLCAVPFPVSLALMATNAALDHSQGAVHRTRVQGFYKRNTHTIWVDSWQQGATREKVILPPFMPTPSVGDELEVTTREGGLGWPWVEDVRGVTR